MTARRTIALTTALLGLHSPARAAPAWDQSVIRLERWPGNADAAEISAAIPVGARLLATILSQPAASDSYRAVTPEGTRSVRLLARDAVSGFSLLTGPDGSSPPWNPVDLPETPAVPAGAALTIQSQPPATARIAGRELLHQSRLLECPWLRVHLPRGTWAVGTPMTGNDGTFAGLLAGGVPGVAEAARVLPAAAVRHFVRLWTERKTLASARIGIRLSPAAGIPRVEECVAALPAERAGIHPGDILLKVGTTSIGSAADAAEACFYLRVDEAVTLSILRGTETMDITVTPVSSISGSPEK